MATSDSEPDGADGLGDVSGGAEDVGCWLGADGLGDGEGEPGGSWPGSE